MKRAAFLLAGAVVALATVTAGTAGVQALITGAQIKDGSIASRDIKNRSIGRADISANALSSLRGPRGLRGLAGAAGAQGPQGPAGAQGPQGTAGAIGAQGPQGEKGEKGDTGAQGAKGDPGAGVHVTGSVPTAADLPTTAAEGDAYIALDTGHLHVWDGSQFVDTGPVRGPTGPQGPIGPTGPQGPQGATGAAGPAGGLSGYQIVTGAAVPIAGTDFQVSGSAACPAGKVAVGGGLSLGDPAGGVVVAESRPTAAGDGWFVTAVNLFEDPNSMTPYAVCATQA